jgi:hypothetical protein
MGGLGDLVVVAADGLVVDHGDRAVRRDERDQPFGELVVRASEPERCPGAAVVVGPANSARLEQDSIDQHLPGPHRVDPAVERAVRGIVDSDPGLVIEDVGVVVVHHQ